jgi:hypothetical protein
MHQCNRDEPVARIRLSASAPDDNQDFRRNLSQILFPIPFFYQMKHHALQP